MTDAPTIFTAHDIPDLLNALPTLFGFRPSESLVAVATRGPRRRLGFRLRVDIPPVHHLDELAELTAEHLRRQGAEGAILVAVTDQQDVAGSLLAAIRSHLQEIELVVAVRADGSRYWVDMPGFPVEGIPYDTSDHHLSIVKAVAAGQQILPDRQALAARFKPVEGSRRHEIMLLTESVVGEIDGADTDDQVQVAMDQVRPILQRGMSGELVSDEDAVRLAVWVSKHEVRDEVWRWISRDSAREMLSFLTHVSGTVVPPFEPAVLSLAAFAGWLSGDGAQALIAVERALEADPSYGMARGVLALLEGGVSPAHWGEF
ncbi:DUF4192 domain-containing protein [Aeromicrobium sp.]|uniref:DUF4192 domain-containing protein n=1 Tax=Aeromicrobium sp. TaxID=1871063 RepID=UPI002FCC76E9